MAKEKAAPTRPRPEPRENAFDSSFALELLAWYDRQVRAGKDPRNLPPLSAEERALMLRSGRSIHSIAATLGLMVDRPVPPAPPAPPPSVPALEEDE